MTQQILSYNKTCCYIRTTKTWAENFKFSNDKFSTTWKIQEIANAWDKIFNISYINFRKKLSFLQKENLKEINFDYIVNQYQYKINNWFVSPIDDDDWFHPNIIEILKTEKNPIIFWDFINYYSGEITTYDSSKVSNKERLQIETNNYALYNPKNNNYLIEHTLANKDLINKAKYINSFLSMRNKSIASLSLLNKIFNKDFKKELLNLYDLYRKPIKILGNYEIPSYFMKYVDKMQNIYQTELKVKKIFF